MSEIALSLGPIEQHTESGKRTWHKVVKLYLYSSISFIDTDLPKIHKIRSKYTTRRHVYGSVRFIFCNVLLFGGMLSFETQRPTIWSLYTWRRNLLPSSAREQSVYLLTKLHGVISQVTADRSVGFYCISVAWTLAEARIFSTTDDSRDCSALSSGN